MQEGLDDAYDWAVVNIVKGYLHQSFRNSQEKLINNSTFDLPASCCEKSLLDEAAEVKFYLNWYPLLIHICTRSFNPHHRQIAGQIKAFRKIAWKAWNMSNPWHLEQAFLRPYLPGYSQYYC